MARAAPAAPARSGPPSRFERASPTVARASGPRSGEPASTAPSSSVLQYEMVTAGAAASSCPSSSSSSRRLSSLTGRSGRTARRSSAGRPAQRVLADRPRPQTEVEPDQEEVVEGAAARLGDGEHLDARAGAADRSRGGVTERVARAASRPRPASRARPPAARSRASRARRAHARGGVAVARRSSPRSAEPTRSTAGERFLVGAGDGRDGARRGVAKPREHRAGHDRTRRALAPVLVLHDGNARRAA